MDKTSEFVKTCDNHFNLWTEKDYNHYLKLKNYIRPRKSMRCTDNFLESAFQKSVKLIPKARITMHRKNHQDLLSDHKIVTDNNGYDYAGSNNEDVL